MVKSTIEALADFGQSIWLDNINRVLLEKGGLLEMIKLCLRGMTSNPSIFEKAVGASSDYDKKILAQLLNDGIIAFEKAFDSLLAVITKKKEELCFKGA